jgi:hypothetical protein
LSIKAKIKRTNPQQITNHQLFALKEPPIQKRSAATAQILHPPAHRRMMQDRMAAGHGPVRKKKTYVRASAEHQAFL